MKRSLARAAVAAITLLIILADSAAAEPLDRTGTQWTPVLQWTLSSSTVEGNPFDRKATVTFTHRQSGQKRRTGMFYDGENQWKFRFTGTAVGLWDFETSSDNTPLDGKRGTVTIEPNPDPTVRGFIHAAGSQFARQRGEADELEAFVPNVYMNYRKYGDGGLCGWTDVSRTFGDSEVLGAYLDEAETHGCNAIQALIGNQWFRIDAASSRDHDSENPDPRTFEALEQAIIAAHHRGMHLHIWAWGDEARGWTPVRVGGVNGPADLRMQRYLAARLGPLPGWTMSYGFDLHEWVTPEQVGRWHEHLRQEMGWPHLLGARTERQFVPPQSLDMLAHDLRVDERFYESAVDLLDQAGGRPAIFERRFAYRRDGVWDMETTRRAFWQFTMAGGVGAIWGHYPPDCSASVAGDYPHPEQLRTHRQFWQQRFRVGMRRDQRIAAAPARVLADNAENLVVYQEDTDRVRLSLARLQSAQAAIAVDTKQAYQEIDLGILEPRDQVWQAPYASDWVIAVGTFSDGDGKASLNDAAMAFPRSSGSVRLGLDQDDHKVTDDQ